MFLIRENDGAVLMDDGAVIDVITDAAGDRIAFGITSEPHEILGGVEVLHALDFLLDDWPCIEICGDVMAGGADEFHAALVGLAVRICADECRQE